MASLDPVPATTSELEAVNIMLAAAGEAPITDVDAATQADVEVALNALRNAVREVCALPWRFNTEFGYQVAPSDTLVWNDTDSEATTLNIFTPPSGLLSWTLTKTADQADLDLVLKRSRLYTTGSPAATTLVFYDRVKNRDGLDASKYDYIYINPVWLVQFDDLPETARRYCVVRAARQFLQQFVGAVELVGFTEKDEQFALRALKREQGEQEDFNVFNNGDVIRHHGRRARPISYLHDPRATPGPA